MINWWFRTLTELGRGAAYRHVLTVPGRKTGRTHSTPVDVIELGGHRWLVAGYGPANWAGPNADKKPERHLARAFEAAPH